MMKRPILLFLALSTIPLAHAGAGYEFTCTGPDGEYKGHINLGGGRAFEQITGYCIATAKFVSLSWKRQESPPQPVQVWDPRSGETLSLYPVKECPAPVAPIRHVEELRNLPPCAGKEFRHRRGMMYD
jgi:hypothetical protein